MLKKERFLKIFFCLCLSLTMLLSATALAALASDENATEKTAPDSIFYTPQEIYDNVKYAHDSSTELMNGDDGVDFIRLSATVDTDDPYIDVTLPEAVSADEYKFVAFIMKKKVEPSYLKAYFGTTEHSEYSEEMAKRTRYNSNTKWQIIAFETTDLPNWSGSLTKIRIDYYDGDVKSGLYCDLAGVVLGKTENAVLCPISELFAKVSGAIQHFHNFSEIDLGYFSIFTNSTTVMKRDVNIVYESIGVAYDPQAMWNYEGYVEYNGGKPLSAEDFGYMVIKYKAYTGNSIKQGFEAFYQTGDRTNAKGGCSATADFTASGEWQSMTLDFTQGPEWAGAVHSFRIDWTSGNTLPQGVVATMEVSDILLFADNKQAATYNSVMNNITVIRVQKEEPEETTEDEFTSSENETLEIVTLETEEVIEETTEETGEETLPEFIETTEETTEELTEEITENTVEITEEPTDEETEEATQKKPGKNDHVADLPDGIGTDTEADSGSQAPFVIACVILAMLSVASIVTVTVIRVKAKKEQ